MATTTRPANISRPVHSGEGSLVKQLLNAASADGSWYPAHERHTLIAFLQTEVDRDPDVAMRLHAHLDDAVAATWRARTAHDR